MRQFKDILLQNVLVVTRVRFLVQQRTINKDFKDVWLDATTNQILFLTDRKLNFNQQVLTIN